MALWDSGQLSDPAARQITAVSHTSQPPKVTFCDVTLSRRQSVGCKVERGGESNLVSPEEKTHFIR